jgi:hypothetical protein
MSPVIVSHTLLLVNLYLHPSKLHNGAHIACTICFFSPWVVLYLGRKNSYHVHLCYCWLLLVWSIGFGPMSLHWLQGMPFWASWLCYVTKNPSSKTHIVLACLCFCHCVLACFTLYFQWSLVLACIAMSCILCLGSAYTAVACWH